MKYLIAIIIFIIVILYQRSYAAEMLPETVLIEIIDEGLFTDRADSQLELLCDDSRWPLRVPSDLKWHMNSLDVTFLRSDIQDRKCHYRLSVMAKDDFNDHLVLRKFIIE